MMRAWAHSSGVSTALSMRVGSGWHADYQTTFWSPVDHRQLILIMRLQPYCPCSLADTPQKNVWQPQLQWQGSPNGVGPQSTEVAWL